MATVEDVIEVEEEEEDDVGAASVPNVDNGDEKTLSGMRGGLVRLGLLVLPRVRDTRFLERIGIRGVDEVRPV